MITNDSLYNTTLVLHLRSLSRFPIPCMDLWQPTTLGHRSVPALWQEVGQKSGQKGNFLGDVRRTPASIQVFNACLLDKMRQRSSDYGLGLAKAAANHSHSQFRSLREYANDRVEQEKRMYETIEATTDVDRLLWEAQVGDIHGN